jgi:hypothetical protein
MTVAVSASAVVATASFVYSVITRRRTQRASELRDWQRVVIYSLIEEASPVRFEELKMRYLQKAKAMLSRRVPNKVIQDDSLKRILLDLQSEGLVVRRADLAYQLQVRLPPG